jgi:hypothetical protein
MANHITKVGWELSLLGVKTYPLRMAFILLGMPSIVGVSFYAVFPAVVFALVPIIGQVVYGDIRRQRRYSSSCVAVSQLEPSSWRGATHE